MDPDDIAYKKSVRNMAFVLAAIVLTIFAAIFASPYLFPPPDTFQQSVTYNSAFGFTMHLQVNTTTLSQGGSVLVSGWLNSSSASIDNVTAESLWGVGPTSLWTSYCTAAWPIGVGVMQGHYTQDNYTLGRLLPLNLPEVSCPVRAATPGYFLFDPHSSRALVDLNGTPQYWVLRSAFTFSASSSSGFKGSSSLPAGVYTAVLADEWGDVVTTNFLVS